MEIKRYNKLLKLVKQSLLNLKDSIDGINIMDSQSEKFLYSILYNRLPSIWNSISYESNKSLSFWFADFI